MIFLIGDKTKNLNLSGTKIAPGGAIPKFKTMEECEDWFVTNSPNFTTGDDNVTFVLCGGDPLVGCTLWLAEQMKNKNIDLVYLYQDSSINRMTQLNNKISFGALQECTRS